MHSERCFRIQNAEPARLGEAGGHAALASEGAVECAGEIQIGDNMYLEAWTLVSGTYQLPTAAAQQVWLPMELFWQFIPAHEATAHESHDQLHPLRGDMFWPRQMPNRWPISFTSS